MEELKLVIFDLDGTLIDAYPAITASFNYAMLKLGYKKQPAGVIRRKVGWGDRDLFKPFIKKSGLPKALSIYRRHHKIALLKNSRLYQGALGLLKYLKARGIKLAVASNRPTRFSLILIRKFELKRYFDFVLCADKVKKGKPSPELLNKIMKKLKVTRRQTLYVGDMAIDAQAGCRAKVKTAIVTGGSSPVKEIQAEKPAWMIKKIADLRRLL